MKLIKQVKKLATKLGTLFHSMRIYMPWDLGRSQNNKIQMLLKLHRIRRQGGSERDTTQ